MENLNAEQIKKALECCGNRSDCTGCYYDENQICGCLDLIMKEALALINSQEQRIKELTEERKDFEIRALRAENQAAMYQDRWETSKKDFERLADENESLKDSNEHLAVFLGEAEADTVRKMQERLKAHLEKPEFPWDSFTVAEEVIDQIAKEMLEGKE